MATCAAAATEAAAQDDSIVLNNQLQLGDVIAGQTLNVVDAQDEVAASTSAQGVGLTGAVRNGSLTVTSTQEVRGSVSAETTVTLGGDTDGPVNAVSQANGTYLGASAYDADMRVASDQTYSGDAVEARMTVGDGEARLLGGASVGASAIANTTALYTENGFVSGDTNQSSDAGLRALLNAASQYIPAEADFSTQAVANAFASNGVASGQELNVSQSSAGDIVEADTVATSGNAWDLVGRANAAANQAQIGNQGGSLVLATDQSNASAVRSSAYVSSYDFGEGVAHAQGVGNAVSAGNNDIFVQIDNAQFNSGGVEVTATFAGANGYDTYVSAEAAGNTVTGYGCSDCEGYLRADNVQINEGAVSAVATATIAGSGRLTASSAHAVGNSATFYVSRPNSGD